jgi:hypothetical protein
MKLFNIVGCTVAMVLGISQVALAERGTVSYRFDNKATGTSDLAVKAAIDRGIGAADGNIPSLPKPWIMEIEIAGGARTGDPAPGFIIIYKSKSAGNDGKTYKCRTMRYGTYMSDELLRKLESLVTEAVGYFAGPDCK